MTAPPAPRSRARRAPRGALLALAAALPAALGACRGSDAQPLELVAVDPFADQRSLVAGGGASATIAFTSAAGSFLPSLRLVRHDPASPDRTTHLGDVSFAGGGAVGALAVGEGAAALTVGGAVRVVDLSDPRLPVEALPALGDASHLAVAGRWVLAAAGKELVLVSRDAPLDTLRFTPGGAPTALLAAQGAFFAFTAQGYVHVDPAAAATTFTEVIAPGLANLRAAHAAGAGAVVAAGPSGSPGWSRVLRLDLTRPAAPAVVRAHEVPGAFVAFAWDGAATSVLAVHASGDGPDPRTFQGGYLIREGPGGFEDQGVPLTFWSQSAQPLAAHAGRLFAAEARGLLLLAIR